MALVLAGFIGRPREKEIDKVRQKGEYERVGYQFESENGFAGEIIEAQVFNCALLKWLKNIGRPAERWLIMGTPQSHWGALIEAVPQEKTDEVRLVWKKIQTCSVSNHDVCEELLQQWESALNTVFMGNLEVSCRLTGNAATPESQREIYASLSNLLRHKDELVFDVTHGLRLQPLTAAFDLMHLKWIRNLTDIQIYNGILELGRNGICPVAKADELRRVMLATEAAAIWRHTGVFSPLVGCLSLEPAERKLLEALSLTEETNRETSKEIALVIEVLGEKEYRPDSLEAATLSRIVSSLKWGLGISLSSRLSERSQFACDHGQYFKSVILLYEAFVVAMCEAAALDEYDFKNREIVSRWDNVTGYLQKGLPNYHDKTPFFVLRALRNTIVHGTDYEPHQNFGEDIQQALYDPQSFIRLMKSSQKALRKFRGNCNLP